MHNLRTVALAGLLAAFAAPSILADAKSEDAALAAARRQHLAPKVEKAGLAAAAGQASRQGLRLTLNLSGGKPLVFTDTRNVCTGEEASDCARYRFVATLPARHAFLVSKHEFESCPTLLLIDERTGRQTALGEVPTFSPDGERLLVQNECEMGGGADDHHLEIWKRNGAGWKREWSFTDEQAMKAEPKLMNLFHSEVASWSGDRIVLRFTATIDGSPSEQKWTGTLTHTPKGWRLDAGRFRSP